jgi:tetratricopeptide (TPR) repeat protein
VIAVNVGRTYQLQRNDVAAIDTFQKLIEVDPAFHAATQYLALSLARQARRDEAVAAAEKAVELSGRNSITLADLGFVFGSSGEKDKANAVIKELEARYAQKQAPAYYIAMVYSGLGEKDKAFEWLEKEFAERGSQLSQIRWQMEFDSLHDDPRFKDLLKRMNLPE